MASDGYIKCHLMSEIFIFFTCRLLAPSSLSALNKRFALCCDVALSTWWYEPRDTLKQGIPLNFSLYFYYKLLLSTARGSEGETQLKDIIWIYYIWDGFLMFWPAVNNIWGHKSQLF